MKTKRKPRLPRGAVALQPHAPHGVDPLNSGVLYWTHALPFNANPRGILIHRVKAGISFLRHGKLSHHAVDYWCGGQCNGEGVSLATDPPRERLLCSRCEELAVEAGEKSAEQLTGRHVHVGRVKAYRECCRESDLN